MLPALWENGLLSSPQFFSSIKLYISFGLPLPEPEAKDILKASMEVLDMKLLAGELIFERTGTINHGWKESSGFRTHTLTKVNILLSAILLSPNISQDWSTRSSVWYVYRPHAAVPAGILPVKMQYWKDRQIVIDTTILKQSYCYHFLKEDIYRGQKMRKIEYYRKDDLYIVR